MARCGAATTLGAVPPDDVQFLTEDETALFAQSLLCWKQLPIADPAFVLRVPKEFLELAAEVGYHRDFRCAGLRSIECSGD